MLSCALLLYVTFCSGDNILPGRKWGKSWNRESDNNKNLTEVLALPYLKLNSRNSGKGSSLWWLSLTKLDKGVPMLGNSTCSESWASWRHNAPSRQTTLHSPLLSTRMEWHYCWLPPLLLGLHSDASVGGCRLFLPSGSVNRMLWWACF